MRLVNLTPHTLNIIRADGSVLNLPPSGRVARVECFEAQADMGPIDGVAITVTAYGSVQGLPEPGEEPGAVYVTSRLVRNAVHPQRYDVLAPGLLVRDDKGQPVGCKGLSL